MRIGHIAKKVLPKNPAKWVTKGIGAVALGAVAYDAHYLGKIQADLYSSEKDAASTGYYLNNSLYSTNMSKIQEGIKDASYEMELDCGWKRFINEGVGYVKGFTSMLYLLLKPKLIYFLVVTVE